MRRCYSGIGAENRVSGDYVKLLLAFLDELDSRNLHYTLEHTRSETIRVNISFPGKIWEVEFFEDARVEIERFSSTHGVKTISIEDLLALIDRTEESADRKHS
jgi:hypothetical protein